MKTAIKDMSLAKDGDGWILWRCPYCNAWDWALQGPVEDTAPGIYSCDECGKPFQIVAT